MKKLTLALVASTFLAAPAIAGGVLMEPAPAPAAPLAFAPQYDWTGFSVGAQLGLGDVDTNLIVNGDEVGDDGAIYGLRAYYDYDFGRFILGGGVQYDEASIDLEANNAAIGIEVESILRVGLRAGIDSGRNWYYATAGYAEVDITGDDSSGYFVGLGYEVFASQNITLGAEVLYHEFDDFNTPGLEADATTAALSVNYRF